MAKPLKTPTIYDVARLAGVSEATVSYVLDGRRGGASRISRATRQQVLDAVEALGYRPNESARSLSRRRTERVCLVLPDLGVPYYDAIAKELQQAANHYNYSTVIATTGSAEQEKQVVDQLRRRLADGVLFISPHTLAENDIAFLVKAGVAVVVYSNHIMARDFDVVRTTEPEARQQAVAYLLAKGHRRIGLMGDASTPAQNERLTAYRRIFQDCGLAVDPALVQSDVDSREKAYYSAQSLFQLKEPPTALLTTTDITAISALWAARDSGRRVPQDIAIVGIGNIAEGKITQPPLTTIGLTSLNFSDVFDLLFSRLRKETPPAGRLCLHHWQLILRGSA
jgi:DNA-binding LacI/PurR family transcriptional regulator